MKIAIGSKESFEISRNFLNHYKIIGETPFVSEQGEVMWHMGCDKCGFTDRDVTDVRLVIEIEGSCVTMHKVDQSPV